ncbi:MAG TPA: hypothetical protein VF603_00475 [Allosphingosinicella sp.]
MRTGPIVRAERFPVKALENRHFPHLARLVLRNCHQRRPGACTARGTNMQDGNLFTRDDTFLGVCEALGEDFRISPLLLRLGMTGFLFFNPIAAIASYLGAGILVALSRWIAPNPRVAAPAMAEPEAVPVEPQEMAIAA